jgi:hypothetical protein
LRIKSALIVAVTSSQWENLKYPVDRPKPAEVRCGREYLQTVPN